MGLSLGNFINDSDSAARRVRLRPKPAATSQIYGSSGLMNPLQTTNGLVWPYQPVITYQQDVDYTASSMVHSNQEIMSYNRTKAVTLSVDGSFTVQNQTEGLYAIACIHFLRTVSKMYFGQSQNAGTPPPVLFFDAYGQYMFNQLPVIVTTFTIGLPGDVDYVPVDMSGLQVANIVNNAIPPALQTIYSNVQQVQSLVSRTPSLTNLSDLSPGTTITKFTQTLGGGPYIWLPAVFDISVGLVVQQTPFKLSGKGKQCFDIDQFRSGALLKQGGWL
jgi:hypothetical protein